MLKKSALLASAILALLSGGVANAAYTVTASTTVPPSLVSTNGSGTTTVTFSPITPQTGIIASNFNVINVAATSSAPITSPNSGSTTLTQNITLTGDSGTQVVSLSGTFTLVAGSVGGVVTTFTNVSVTTLSGSGYTVSFAGYAPPSPGSTPGSINDGAISIIVIPNAVVPEPASVAMVGLGLGTLGLVTARRRRAAK